MKIAKLSELATAYMEHHEEIAAGAAAFAADVKRILDAVADRTRKRGIPVEASDGCIQTDLEVPATDDPLRLRLWWDEGTVWPEVMINEQPKTDIGKEKWWNSRLWVFINEDFQDEDLPRVNEGALLEDPVAECARLWEEALAFPTSRAYAVRETGMRLVDEVSQHALGELAKLDLPATRFEMKPGEAAGETGWPWYFQWLQAVGGTKGEHKVEWAFTFFPRFEHEGSRPGPALLLVAYNGGSVAGIRDDAAVSGHYDEGPILGDWSKRLAEAVEHPERRSEIARNIAKEVVKTYQRVLKNVRRA